MRLAVLALGALLGACASYPRIAELGPEPVATELDATPFFPQSEFQCGPAALATALAASGVDVTPDELTPRIYLPGRRGSLQAEMVATARAYGRVPYPLSPELKDLLAEVAAGHPVLVLQNLGLSFWPTWHYAVVVGYDASENVLILRSGTQRRKLESLRAFARSWRLAKYWALVLARPEQPPTTAQLHPWLYASIGYEELGRPQLAEAAYLAATQRWPAEPLAWQMLGNVRYNSGDLSGAEVALRAAAAIKPDAATLNNLAQVLLKRGCPAQARALVDQALGKEAPGPLAELLGRTRDEIDAWRGTRSASCAP